MRRKHGYIMLLLLASSAGITLRAQPYTCAPDTVAGADEVAIRGTVTAPVPGGGAAVPIAGLGVATIDSTGAVFFAGYQSIGGQVSPEQMKGTITVNSNCTANAAFAGGITETLVVNSGGDEMTFLMLAEADIVRSMRERGSRSL